MQSLSLKRGIYCPVIIPNDADVHESSASSSKYFDSRCCPSLGMPFCLSPKYHVPSTVTHLPPLRFRQLPNHLDRSATLSKSSNTPATLPSGSSSLLPSNSTKNKY